MSDSDNSARPGQQEIPNRRAEFPAGGSIEMIDAATLKNPVISGSSTVTLGESPSLKMATSYNSDMLPDPPLPILKSNLHQSPSVQMTDKLFDHNMKPLASKLTMGTGFSDSPSMDILHSLIKQLPSRHVGKSGSDQILATTQSAELGRTFDSDLGLPGYRLSNATSQLQQAPFQDPESFMKAIASLGESQFSSWQISNHSIAWLNELTLSKQNLPEPENIACNLPFYPPTSFSLTMKFPLKHLSPNQEASPLRWRVPSNICHLIRLHGI